MYKVKIIFLMIMLSLFAVQCKKKKDAAASEGSAHSEAGPLVPRDVLQLREITVNSEYQWPGSTHAYSLLSSSINGDTLILEVQYGGGCETHDWKLYSNEMWMKSLPPKMELYLEHNNYGDMCRAMITQKLHFNLKPLRYKGGKQANFIIKSEPDQNVEYKY